MTHSHSHSPGGHGHAHGVDRSAGTRGLTIALVLVASYMLAEVIGGVLARSLALLADAGHMFSDAASLALALWAIRIARRPRDARRTFGWHRTEILAALANGIALVVVAVYIVIEAWGRLRAPQEVDGPLMMAIATGGLAVNVAAMAALHRGRSESLNVRGAWLHVVADTLGSVQAVAAGALIWAFGWNWVDPVAGALIALLVAASAWSILRDSIGVLLEGAPAHVDAHEVQRALEGVPGIVDVHDLHIWTITSGFEALTVHGRVDVGAAGRDRDAILAEAQSMLRERFGIDHATIQLEGGDGCPPGMVCE